MSEQASSPTSYFAVFGALLVLTLITAGVAYVPLGVFSDPVALLIASFKAGLVIVYFMHARHAEKLVTATIFAAILFLIILFTFTMADFLSRDWAP